MDYHHLDPSIKERGVSQMISGNSWKKIEEEISKCILVCANCHRKIHEDLITHDNEHQDTSQTVLLDFHKSNLYNKQVNKQVK
jgi:hypothetical protein